MIIRQSKNDEATHYAEYRRSLKQGQLQRFLFSDNSRVCGRIYIVIESLFRYTINRPNILAPNRPVG